MISAKAQKFIEAQYRAHYAEDNNNMETTVATQTNREYPCGKIWITEIGNQLHTAVDT